MLLRWSFSTNYSSHGSVEIPSNILWVQLLRVVNREGLRSRRTPAKDISHRPTRTRRSKYLPHRKHQEENASLRSNNCADGYPSPLPRPPKPLHKTVTTARKPGLEAVAASTTLYDGRGGGGAWGVKIAPSPGEVGSTWNQDGSGEAISGQAGATTATSTAAVWVDGRRELSLKQLHVRPVKLLDIRLY